MDLLSFDPESDESKKEEVKKGFLARLKKGLTKTRTGLTGSLDRIKNIGKNVDDDIIEELEEAMILSDMGVETTGNIIAKLEKAVKKESLFEADKVKAFLLDEISSILNNAVSTMARVDFKTVKPYVVLLLGVNGSGKTTTIGKLAYNLSRNNRKVLLAAGDTFRAAAIEQLEVWGKRSGVQVVRHNIGSDPAAVVYDSIKAAVSRNVDVLLIDTAGRLHNREDLMNELVKIKKVINKEIEGAPHETLLVLDATTGQNGVVQAKVFMDLVDVSGIVLTKLDGTSKGGVVVNISESLKIPVRFIGIGEGVEDLRKFDPESFASAIFEE